MPGRWSWKSAAPLLIAGAIAAVMIVLLGLSHLDFERESLRSSQRHQLTIARSMAAAVEQVFSDVEAALRALPGHPDAIAQTAAAQQILDAHYRAEENSLNNISLADANGNLTLRCPKTEQKVNISQWPEFVQARNTGTACVGRPEFCAVNPGEKVVRVLVPIGTPGDFRGAIYGGISLKKLWTKCFARAEIGRKSLCWVIDAGGLILYDTEQRYLYRTWEQIEKEWHQRGGPGSPEGERAEAAVRKRVQDGEEGVAEFVNNLAGGIPELVSFAPIHLCGSHYGLAVVTPKAEIMGPVEAHVRLTYLLVGGMIVLFAIAGYVTYHGVRNAARLEEHRRAAEALQESEQRFRLLYEQAPVGYQSLDEEGRFLAVNQAWLDALGYCREEVIGRWFGDFQAPKDKEEFPRRFARFKETGQIRGEEVEMVRKDGTRIIALFEGRIGRDEQGRFQQTHCVFHDITARKLAEHALRESEERYRTMVERQLEAVCRWLGDTTLTFVNEGYCRYFGRKREDLIGRKWLELVPDASREGIRTFYESYVADPKPYTYEHEVIGADGQVRWQQWTDCPITDAQGRAVEFQSVGRDITGRKRAEEALRMQRDFAESLIETAHAVVVVLDANGNIVRFNRFGEDLTGWTEEEARGRRAPDIFLAPEDRPQAAEALKSVLAGQTTQGELDVLARDGREISTRWYASLLRDAEGKVTGALGIFHDVTELKRKEEQFRQAQKMEAIGRLAGGIAHDFNNQLTVVKGYCDLLLKDLPPANPLREPLEEIRKAAIRSATLTAQLLTFSRRQMLHPLVISLNDLLRELEGPLARMIGEDIRLTILASPHLGNVKADPAQVEQALMNLAVNSRDAMPEGGRLTIETADVPLDEAYARRHVDVTPGPYVMLAVSDTGAGMDPATLERVFEPFFTTKPVGQGTGLGLAMVYGFIKQSGGHVHVYSEPGGGTTFKLYLPRVDAPAEDAPLGAAIPEVLRGGGETILVAEDDPAVRQIIVRVLRECGYRVMETSGAQEALSEGEHARGRIDLLITDVVMPGMGGPELVNRLRGARREMNVLYVSGYTENGAAPPDMGAPGVHLLTKPFTPYALAAMVRGILDAGPAIPPPAGSDK